MTSFDRQLRLHRHRVPDHVVVYDPDQFTSRDEAFRAGLRMAGCTCRPEVVMEHDGVRWTAIHDDWCALLRCEDTY